MSASDYRAKAREALAGQWPTAVLVGLVAALLGGAGNSSSGLTVKVEERVSDLYSIAPEIATILMGAMGVISVFAFAYAIAMLILGGVVQQGYCRYNLKIVDGHMATMGDLFSQFGRFKDALVLNLLTALFTALWSLLFIIPGIVAAYRYAMAPYILLEDPDCTPMEAISRSKEMMDGHKGELFCLDLSFIGWEILSALTAGIGSLFLRPYTSAARAAFYRETQRQQRARASSYQEPL